MTTKDHNEKNWIYYMDDESLIFKSSAPITLKILVFFSSSTSTTNKLLIYSIESLSNVRQQWTKSF